MKKTISAYVMDGNVKWLRASDVMKLDILYYAFSTIRDGKPGLYGLHNTDLLMKMKTLNPNLKIIVSIGGWGAGGFSEAAFSEEGRRIFVDAALAYVRAYGFDGIDMDWEYPCSSAADIASHPDDKHNFTLLLKKLREALDASGREVNRKIYLTAAVGAGMFCVEGIEAEQVGQLLDYVNLMTYDMRNGNANPAGHHTNLFPQTGDETGMSGDVTVQQYADAGIPVEKMVLGAAFYGRVWKKTAGFNQRSESASTMPFTEIYWKCLHKGRNETETHTGYDRHWDEQAKAPYLYNGEDYISYDDEESIACKCRYVTERGLAGIMYWEYGNDKTFRLLDAMTDPANWA